MSEATLTPREQVNAGPTCWLHHAPLRYTMDERGIDRWSCTAPGCSYSRLVITEGDIRRAQEPPDQTAAQTLLLLARGWEMRCEVRDLITESGVDVDDLTAALAHRFADLVTPAFRFRSLAERLLAEMEMEVDHGV